MIKNYHRLVPRYLASNKKTTISMMISILLSVMLLVSVGMIISLYNNARVEMIQGMYGKYYAGFFGIEDDLVDKLKKFDGISKIGTTMIMGNIQSDEYKMEIKGADPTAMDLWNAKAIKGRLPGQDNEIAIEEWIYNKMEYKPQIGEKFKLDYSYTDPNGGEVTQKENEFTLCGILADSHDSKMLETGKAYVTLNTVLSQTVKYHRRFEQWFTLKDNLPIDGTLKKINEYALTKEHTNDNIIGGYRPNRYYIQALKEAQIARDVTIFFNLIVALAVAMVIYNVFNISVLQRRKHYGLLKAIGITQRQIKGMLFYEAFLFGAIIIPIGIILGILSTLLILNIISGNASVGSALNGITPFNIIFPACVCMLSIIAAVYRPAKLASRISPIESLTMEDVKLNTKTHIASAAIAGKFIGFTGRMAITNLKRYKKRFIATITAIGVGIALFVFSTYVIDFLNPDRIMEDRVRSDYVLALSNEIGGNYGYSDEAAIQAMNIPGVKSVNKLDSVHMTYNFDSNYITPNTIDELNKGQSLPGIYIKFEGYNVSTQVYGCSDEFIQSLRDSIPGGDKKNNAQVFIVQNLNNQNYTTLKNGDEVLLEFNYLNEGKFDFISKKIKVDYVLDKLPMKIYKPDGYIATFVPYKYLEDNFNVTGYQKIEVNVDEGADINKVETELQSIAGRQKYGQLVIYRDELEKWHNIRLQVGAILLSLVLVIVIVGLINIMNTMNMNIIIRKREFGMLRALGMTKKEMMKALLKEAMLYGLASSIIGVTTGYLLIDIVYNLVKARLEITFHVDLVVLISTFIAAILLSMLSIIFPLKKATSEDIVESIQAVE